MLGKRGGISRWRRAILRKLIAKIIVDKDRANVTIRRHIPLNCAKNDLNYGFRFISRDRWGTKQYFLPFQFLVKLLPSGEGRRIVSRDRVGRIVQSDVIRVNIGIF